MKRIRFCTFIVLLFVDRVNRLSSLPRGFGAFPVLEVLDLTYNNLDEKSLPANFFCLGEFYVLSERSHCQPAISVSVSSMSCLREVTAGQLLLSL